MKVYLVAHVRELADAGEDLKIVGIYSSSALASAAVARAGTLPGFAEHLQGFEVSEYELDTDHWTEGFASV